MCDVGNQIDHNKACVQFMKTQFPINFASVTHLGQANMSRHKLSVHNFDNNVRILAASEMQGIHSSNLH